MPDNKAPSAQESTDETLRDLTKDFPGLMQAYNAQIAPTEAAKLQSAQTISPAYAKLMNDLYQQYAPGLAATGSQINEANRMKSAQNDAAILAGPGADLSKTYRAIDEQANPEYYATRKAEAGKLSELLGSINIDNPAPEAERLVSQENARTGNTGNTSSTNTVKNALQFGDERLKRQSTLNSALNTATQFLQPASNQSFNPATTILNRPTSNTGLSQFGGVTKPGDEAFSSGAGLLNTISGFQNNASQINANRRDVLDRVDQLMPY